MNLTLAPALVALTCTCGIAAEQTSSAPARTSLTLPVGGAVAQSSSTGASSPGADSPGVRSPAAGSKDVTLSGPADYTVLASGRAWYVAPAGRLTFPGAGSIGTRLDYLGADDPAIKPSGEVRIAADKWLFGISGAAAGADATTRVKDSRTIGTLAVASGELLKTTLDFTSAHAWIGYNLLESDFGSGGSERFRLYGLAGGRINDLSLNLTRLAGGSLRTEVTAAEPMIGALAELTLAEHFHVDLQLSVGGLSDSRSFDVAVAFRYNPVPWLSLDVGYRLLSNSLTDSTSSGDVKSDLSYAGLLFGASIRF